MILIVKTDKICQKRSIMNGGSRLEVDLKVEQIDLPHAERAYKGHPAHHECKIAILAMLDQGSSWSKVCVATGASRSTLQRLVKAQSPSRRCRVTSQCHYLYFFRSDVCSGQTVNEPLVSPTHEHDV